MKGEGWMKLKEWRTDEGTEGKGRRWLAVKLVVEVVVSSKS